MYYITHLIIQNFQIKCPDPECGWPIKKFDKNFINRNEENNFDSNSGHYLYRRGTGKHHSYVYLVFKTDLCFGIEKLVDYNVHGLTAKIVGGQDSEVVFNYN